VRRAVLKPVATIITDRRRAELAGWEPTERVELRDDRVSSIVGLHRGPAFQQIEVEAVSPGADGLMDEVSDALIERVPSRPKRRSLRRSWATTPSRRSSSLKREPESRCATSSASRSDRVALRLIAHDPVARIGSDPEAIHQARVATRRLRSDLKTLEPIMSRTAVEKIMEELRWVGELLSSVRDKQRRTV
jgi:inorganic triphosphatase YgiF